MQLKNKPGWSYLVGILRANAVKHAEVRFFGEIKSMTQLLHFPNDILLNMGQEVFTLNEDSVSFVLCYTRTTIG